MAHSRTASARLVQRAKIIELAKDGRTIPQIVQLLQVSEPMVRKWWSALSTTGWPVSKRRPGLAFNRLTPEDCGAFFTFATDQARSLNEAKLELGKQRTQLERDLQSKQRALSQLNGQRGTDRVAATIEVTLPEPGVYTLELSYILPGASWTPQYDVRVDAEHHQVTLTYQGLVSQSTGEEWLQVGLNPVHSAP